MVRQEKREDCYILIIIIGCPPGEPAPGGRWLVILVFATSAPSLRESAATGPLKQDLPLLGRAVQLSPQQVISRICVWACGLVLHTRCRLRRHEVITVHRPL